MHEGDRRVVGLIRVSTKEQAEDDRGGIPRQREVIRGIVAARDLTLVGDPVEINDVSGTDVRRCPEILRILGDLRSGAASGVVVADFDRFIRPDTLGKFGMLDVFEETGATLYYQGGEVDFSGDTGFLNAGFQALIAGNEIRTFKRRVQGAKEEKRKQGKCPSSSITLPLGVSYDRKDERYFYDDDIRKVQEAFRLLDEGACQSVAAVARQVGLTPRGMAIVLRNPVYIGVRRYTHRRGNDKYVRADGRQAGRKKVRRPPDEVITVRVIDEPAVAEDRFQRVQRILQEGRSAWETGRKAGRIHLGSGILRCGACGAGMNCKSGTRRGGRKKRGYYVCKHNDAYWRRRGKSCAQPNVPEEEMEVLIVEFVSSRLADPVFLKSVVQHHIDMLQDAASEQAVAVKARQQQVRKLELRLEKMEELFYAGGFRTPKEYICKRDEAEQELQLARVALSANRNVSVASLEPTIRRIVKGALAFHRITDRAAQRGVLLSLVSTITVKGREITGFAPRLQGAHADVCERYTHTGRGSWPPQA